MTAVDADRFVLKDVDHDRIRTSAVGELERDRRLRAGEARPRAWVSEIAAVLMYPLCAPDKGGTEKAINMAFSRRQFLAGLAACPGVRRSGWRRTRRRRALELRRSAGLGRGRSVPCLLHRRRAIAD